MSAMEILDWSVDNVIKFTELIRVNQPLWNPNYERYKQI
jgi:hypothetical protein